MSPKKVDRESRRRDVLAAASVVFARRGYSAATVDEIAETAGLAKGTVYLSFKSKEDLFFALFESTAKDAMQATILARDNGIGALDTIGATLIGIARVLEDDPLLIPLTMEFWSVCGVEVTRTRFSSAFAQMFAGFRDLLVSLLREGQSAGEIDGDIPLEATAAALMALIDGLSVQQWVVPGFSMSKALKEALPTLLRGARP